MDAVTLYQRPDAPDAPPPVLLPYQQAWIADEAQLKVWEKSRRVGATWAEAADSVLIAAAEGGENYFYISAAQDMAREFIEAVAMWARAFNYVASAIGEGLYDDGVDPEQGHRYIKTFEVSFPATGRRIVALSSRPTNLRGKQGTIGIDEAAFAPDLAGLLKAAMAMLLWGSKVRIWSTHQGVENPFAELINDIRAGKRGADATVHRITFADAVAQGLYRRVCLRKGITWTQAAEDKWVAEARKMYGDDAAEELDVVPSQSGGAYLSLALISQRMVAPWSPTNPNGPVIVRQRWDDAFAYLPEDVRRFAIDGWLAEAVAPHVERLHRDRRHVIGGDFGRIADLSVFPVLEEDIDLTRRPRIVLELENCPFSSQEQILFYLVDRLPRFRGGALDATGNGAALAEKAAQRYGTEMIEQVKMSQVFYLANMPKLRADLQDGTLCDLPRDEAHQSDLRAIRLVNGIPKVPDINTLSAAAKAAAAEGGVKKRRHGDYAIALLLADYAWYRECGEIAFDAAPDRASRWSGPASDDNRTLRMRPRLDDDLIGGYGGGGTW